MGAESSEGLSSGAAETAGTSIQGAEAGGMAGGPWGAVIGGVVGAGLGIIKAHSARKAEKERRQYNLWLENTKHQREVADLRAAGLNPILSATQGMGQVSSAAAAQAAPVPDIGSDVSQGISSAQKGYEQVASTLALQRASQEIANLRQTQLQTQAQTELTDEQRHNQWLENAILRSLFPEMPGLRREEMRAKIAAGFGSGAAGQASAKLSATQIDSLKNTIEGQKLDLIKKRTKGEINDSAFGKAMNYLESISESLGIKGGTIIK